MSSAIKYDGNGNHLEVGIGKGQQSYAKGNGDYLSPIDALKLQRTAYLGFDHYPDETDKSPAGGVRERPATTTYLQRVLSLPTPITATTLRPIKAIAIPSVSPAPIRGDESYEGSSTTRNASRYLSMPPRQHHSIHQQPLSSVMATNSPMSRAKTHSIQDINALELVLPSFYPQEKSRYRPLNPSATGFRYVLPNQYHEEQEFDQHKSHKAGSYGYVDPFGIRRVVYYNASPGKGFIHRNSNRYVGVKAPPYDEGLTAKNN